MPRFSIFLKIDFCQNPKSYLYFRFWFTYLMRTSVGLVFQKFYLIRKVLHQGQQTKKPRAQNKIKNTTSKQWKRDMKQWHTLHMPQIANEASKQFRRRICFSLGSFLAISIEDLCIELEPDFLTSRGWSQACRSRKSINNMFT